MLPTPCKLLVFQSFLRHYLNFCGRPQVGTQVAFTISVWQRITRQPRVKEGTKGALWHTTILRAYRAGADFGGKRLQQGSPRQRPNWFSGGFFLLHVEEAEPREAVFFEEPFVDELLMELLDLRSGHFPSVGSELAVGGGPDLQEQIVRSRGVQDGK